MKPNADLFPVCGTPMAIGRYCPQCASDYEEAHHNPNDDFDYMDDIWNDCKEQTIEHRQTHHTGGIMIDNVNHPRHYERGPFECIELAQHFNFCIGNAIKYVWRHMDKGHPVEDLAKAKWYVEREAKRLNSTVCEPAQWMSRRYRLLRKLEQCNHADARDFWTHLRVGSLAHMATDLDTMILRAQEAEHEPHQA